MEHMGLGRSPYFNLLVSCGFIWGWVKTLVPSEPQVIAGRSPELARPLRHGLAQVVGATLELGGHLRISGAEPWVVK